MVAASSTIPGLQCAQTHRQTYCLLGCDAGFPPPKGIYTPHPTGIGTGKAHGLSGNFTPGARISSVTSVTPGSFLQCSSACLASPADPACDVHELQPGDWSESQWTVAGGDWMCPEWYGLDGEYPAPSGPQRAPTHLQFDRTSQRQDSRQGAATVDQVIGLGHITLSRAKNALNGFLHTGLRGIIP